MEGQTGERVITFCKFYFKFNNCELHAVSSATAVNRSSLSLYKVMVKFPILPCNS